MEIKDFSEKFSAALLVVLAFCGATLSNLISARAAFSYSRINTIQEFCHKDLVLASFGAGTLSLYDFFFLPWYHWFHVYYFVVSFVLIPFVTIRGNWVVSWMVFDRGRYRDRLKRTEKRRISAVCVNLNKQGFPAPATDAWTTRC